MGGEHAQLRLPGLDHSGLQGGGSEWEQELSQLPSPPAVLPIGFSIRESRGCHISSGAEQESRGSLWRGEGGFLGRG